MNILIGSDYLPEENKPFHKSLFKIIKIIILVIEIKRKIKKGNVQIRIKP